MGSPCDTHGHVRTCSLTGTYLFTYGTCSLKTDRQTELKTLPPHLRWRAEKMEYFLPKIPHLYTEIETNVICFAIVLPALIGLHQHDGDKERIAMTHTHTHTHMKMF